MCGGVGGCGCVGKSASAEEEAGTTYFHLLHYHYLPSPAPVACTDFALVGIEPHTCEMTRTRTCGSHTRATVYVFRRKTTPL